MKKTTLCLMVLVGAVLVACAGVTYADIVNPSFETPVLTDTASGFFEKYADKETKYGWTQDGGDGVDTFSYIGLPGTYLSQVATPPDGDNVLVFRRSGGVAVQQSQTLAPLAAGDYTVSGYISGLTGLDCSEYIMMVYDVTSSTWLGGVSDNATWISNYGLVEGASAAAGSWTKVSCNVAAPAGDTLMVVMAPVTDGFIAFDNLSMAPVPEPSSIVLFTMAGMGLLAYAWRKRK